MRARRPALGPPRQGRALARSSLRSGLANATRRRRLAAGLWRVRPRKLFRAGGRRCERQGVVRADSRALVFPLASADSRCQDTRGFVFPRIRTSSCSWYCFLSSKKRKLQGGGAGCVGKHARWPRAAPYTARAPGSRSAGTPGLLPLRFGFAFKTGPVALAPGPTLGPCTALLSAFSFRFLLP